jgi:hypothetical protein
VNIPSPYIPSTQHARSHQGLVAESEFFPGQPCKEGGRDQDRARIEINPKSKTRDDAGSATDNDYLPGFALIRVNRTFLPSARRVAM